MFPNHSTVVKKEKQQHGRLNNLIFIGLDTLVSVNSIRKSKKNPKPIGLRGYLITFTCTCSVTLESINVSLLLVH